MAFQYYNKALRLKLPTLTSPAITTLQNAGTNTNKDVAFALGTDPGGMIEVTLSDTDMSGQTVALAADTVATSEWDGDGNATLTLPAATNGAYVVVRQSAAADNGATYISLVCAGSDTYEADQTVGVGLNKAAQNDCSVAADTDLRITIAADVNNGWGSVGSSIVAYCRDEGTWLVKVYSVTAGTAASTTIAFS